MARIVLIDDDPMIHDLVGLSLDQKHSVKAVAEGEDAIEAIHTVQPDLIILDCALPDLPGNVILSDIRGSELLKTIPVLVLTARRSEWHRRAMLDLGADDYISKPFDPAEFAGRVDALLQKGSAGTSGTM
ncbi:hypothetical protein GCM10023219_27230 [Stakelama sediminis]|uniref:DNA-binding response OmpR family regulator n=1 Tax=Stakelama sediminis TaxID=463200 RepID=A0A840YYH5_9SPHN|nr:response regulator transcription factor [Stakelama sediminis]MBB5718597.1 DNA-binding response OmpR family regulator [Stakelama sediminis]